VHVRQLDPKCQREHCAVWDVLRHHNGPRHVRHGVSGHSVAHKCTQVHISARKCTKGTHECKPMHEDAQMHPGACKYTQVHASARRQQPQSCQLAKRAGASEGRAVLPARRVTVSVTMPRTPSADVALRGSSDATDNAAWRLNCVSHSGAGNAIL